ncbi:ABC transporter ATP-binding protein [Rhizobium paknamense]|uniref:Spermidine/putrescine transport system ATP-binding protein/spermidine/putrescine transport system ATP-binding protein n=1 Tax=Rhizobium paknamense TaxID=1206817 RepID=A0ABU0IID4_9HYPH|nr:ABC transporter ATP-binding protein [Rhizobium paknamense]MDQ0458026.1 putative spermidine/putrescine transport system ATP-binding protein/spermidine/putrescine transport system ATP-binding protein [Rhizobium paknamense]
MIFDLELLHVGKVYDNGTPAVIDFNLAVNKGEFIAFLGPSGCGKTTTLRMIAGFESISSGDMMIKGVRMNDLPPQHRPTSMIFQNYALFPHMTVRRNVGYGLEVKGMPKAERDAKVDRILATLGLEDIAERKPDRLSGGQRQRIALARGLVVEPDILLLDEPLGALDANLRKAIQNELKLLQKTLGVTFIFVTHAQSEALALSDRIVVMSQGRIEQVSPPHQLYTRPNTPFVAQFIGRNTLFPGRLRGLESEIAVVDTGHGLMRGMANASAALSGDVQLVVPAEAIEITSSGVSGLENAVPARVARFDVVGHVSHILATLEDGRSVSLEAHVEKYRPGSFAVDAPVTLSWKPEAATVIPAA